MSLNQSKIFARFIKFFTISSFLVISVTLCLIWFLQKKPTTGGNFTLNYQNQPWNFKDHAKKLNLLYFGYVKCPDVCPMSLSLVAQALKNVTLDQANQVQMIFISVDYKNDTASSVADYAKQFNSSFIGLTGEGKDIDKAVQQFAASYIVEKNEKSYLGYSISHTDRIFYLNDKGIVLDYVASPRSADEIYNKIKENL